MPFAPGNTGGEDENTKPSDKDENEDKGDDSHPIEIQQLHDLSVALGAKCNHTPGDDEDEDDDEAEDSSARPSGDGGMQFKAMGAQVDGLQKALGESQTELQKALGELVAVRASHGQLKASLEKLEKRLGDLEAQPAPVPDAPVINPVAVEKTLGAPPRQAADFEKNGDTAALEAAYERATGFEKQYLGQVLAFRAMKQG